MSQGGKLRWRFRPGDGPGFQPLFLLIGRVTWGFARSSLCPRLVWGAPLARRHGRRGLRQRGENRHCFFVRFVRFVVENHRVTVIVDARFYYHEDTKTMKRGVARGG